MKLLVCLCSITCCYAQLENITSSFNFPEETVVPVVLNYSIGNNFVFPMTLHIRVSRYDLYLSLNEFMISPNFISIYFDNDGQMIKKKGYKNCYYQGRVEPFEYQDASFQNWKAGVSTCNGLHGQFGNSEDGYIFIKPIGDGSSEIEQDHLLYYEPPSTDLFLNETVMENDYFMIPNNRSRPFMAFQRRVLPSGFYIIELVLFNDYDQYVGLGRDIDITVTHAINLINMVDMLFFSLSINVVLTMVFTWSNGNLITYPSSNDIGEALEIFHRYLRAQSRLQFDLALLISGRTFRDSALGVAYVPGICEGSMYGGLIVGRGLRSVDRVSITAAHEIGHTLGMEHDNEIHGCECRDPTGYCIMESTLYDSVGLYSQWSSCSRNVLNNPSAMFHCLFNNPMKFTSSPTCGNGVVEGEEECDCNSPQNCADFSSCCDMTICKYFNSSTLCRPSNSSCDVPDFCFGNSSLCPNQYIADGQPCQTGKGSSFCLNSVCISPHDQCKSIFGPSSTRGVMECFLQNELGSKQGHCGIDSVQNQYKACSDMDRLCGLLHCEGGRFGGNVTASTELNGFKVNDSNGDEHTCLSFTTLVGHMSVNESILVSQGTPCGTNQICSCMAQTSACSPTFMSLNVPCTSGSGGSTCSGAGRCTNLGLCSCDPEFYGDTCNITNECMTGHHNCEQICVDLEDGYRCTCYSGYELDSNRMNCSDINECLDNNGGCEQECINMEGTFFCNCSEGFYQTINDSDCIEFVDECETDNGNCSQECTDSMTSFFCSCDFGYQLGRDGFACEDTDECELDLYDLNTCHQCINTPGSFNCSCNEGFYLNGSECRDIDACSTVPHTCHSCLDLRKGFMCVCKRGYQVGSDNASCVDMDECAVNNGGCSTRCSNKEGSFECSCNHGYKLAADRLSCNDRDECLTDTDNCHHNCVNTDGGYFCTCRSGYTLAANGSCLECLTMFGKCDQICDKGVCKCFENFTLNEDGRTCSQFSPARSPSSEKILQYFSLHFLVMLIVSHYT